MIRLRKEQVEAFAVVSQSLGGAPGASVDEKLERLLRAAQLAAARIVG